MAYKKPNIVNSQFIHIEQTPAAIGWRIVASVIDSFLIGMYYSFVGGFFGMIEGSSDVWKYLAILIILAPIFYPLICEQFFNGMTAGKKVVGIRVVMQDGSAVTMSSSFLRWVLYLIDYSFFLVGLIVMMCNKRNMRLGDLAAGTIVIRDRLEVNQIMSLAHFTFINDDYKPTFPFAADMTWGQINFINHTCSRAYYYSLPKDKQENIKMLAKKIAEKYNIEVAPSDSNDFLCTIINDYNYYTWHDNV